VSVAALVDTLLVGLLFLQLALLAQADQPLPLAETLFLEF
jgi:hypothetical protein